VLMANTTVKGAYSIHGRNPQDLIENVIRNRIYESLFWKEHCFALTAASLIDKAIELQTIGGVYGKQRPTEFICLLLKLLQIQPEKEILIEYLQAEEFKYLRALAAMYIRLTFQAAEVYSILEPMMKDYRKLRVRSMVGYSITHMDSFADDLLTQERVCDIILPRIAKRSVLEDLGELGPRRSLLLDVMEGREKSRSRSRSSGSRSSSRDRSVGRGGGKFEEEDGEDRRGRSRNGTGDDEGYKSRSPSRSRSGSKERYISRSRSRSKTPDGSNRFRSRSRSVSADRMEAE